MFVKICGTTNLEDAELAVASGADALGFIFAASKRRVTVEQAAAITRKLPAGVERVGVFTVPDVVEIRQAVMGAGLTAVQMHWPYERALVEELRGGLHPQVKLWQVVGYAVDPENAEAAEGEFTYGLRAAMHDPRLDVVLLDAVKDQRSGGLGASIPWGRAGSILRTARLSSGEAGMERGFTPPRVVLAGGLRAENVREATMMIGPWGVDVVSGVEAEAGKKDPVRLRAFMRAARERE